MNLRSIEEIRNQIAELNSIYEKAHSLLLNKNDKFNEAYKTCQIIESYINALEWVLGKEVLFSDKTIYGI